MRAGGKNGRSRIASSRSLSVSEKAVLTHSGLFPSRPWPIIVREVQACGREARDVAGVDEGDGREGGRGRAGAAPRGGRRRAAGGRRGAAAGGAAPARVREGPRPRDTATIKIDSQATAFQQLRYRIFDNGATVPSPIALLETSFPPTANSLEGARLGRSVMGEPSVYRQLGIRPDFTQIGRKHGLRGQAVARRWARGGGDRGPQARRG